MKQIDNQNANASFFPNSKKSNAATKTTHLGFERNTLERKKALDIQAKNDVNVDITDAVKDFSKIKKAVDAAPEIDNSEKISSLKSRIKSGTYDIDYEALADKMLASEY